MLGGFSQSVLKMLNSSRAGRTVGNLGLNAAGLGLQGWSAAGALMGRTGRAAAAGALAGGAWGMISGDTSVIGGAMMGAGLAAGGSRYGRPAIAGFIGSLRAGMGTSRAARVAGGFAYAGMKSDALALYGKGSRLASNAGYGFKARAWGMNNRPNVMSMF